MICGGDEVIKELDRQISPVPTREDPYDFLAAGEVAALPYLPKLLPDDI